MKWYSYFICIILIISGFFTSMLLIDLFSVRSAEYGKVISIETQNNYEDVAKFDYVVIDFSSDDYINYQNISTYSHVDFDGTKHDYLLLFNGKVVSNIQVFAGKIVASYTINIYDTSGSIISSPNMNFLIEFLDGETKITINTVNQDSSISYLNQYMNVNGAILKVVTKGEKI